MFFRFSCRLGDASNLYGRWRYFPGSLPSRKGFQASFFELLNFGGRGGVTSRLDNFPEVGLCVLSILFLPSWYLGGRLQTLGERSGGHMSKVLMFLQSELLPVTSKVITPLIRYYTVTPANHL